MSRDALRRESLPPHGGVGGYDTIDPTENGRSVRRANSPEMVGAGDGDGDFDGDFDGLRLGERDGLTDALGDCDGDSDGLADTEGD